MASARPRALTIAGSDSGGGAGVQADLKAFQANGCYGLTVLAALTAQNTLGVQAIHDVPPEFVAAQLDSVLADIGADAAKTGMLSRPEVIEVVAERLRRFGVRNLVVDPVMVSKSGHRLLRPEAVDALRRRLLPLAELATPNLEEVADLVGQRPANEAEMLEAAKAVRALGPRAVLVKGGHLGPEAPHSNDVLWDGVAATVLPGRRLAAVHTHGTGCTLSASIAAQLAHGRPLAEAVANAKRYLEGAMERAWPLGGGIGPVDHAWNLSGFA
ncbi:MAG: bifunctional hydroxymethylpyrimidine kinase/phosphomethylpyrimidine kinase [Candidatus Sumerlaeia bacterium]|nr:bifunctional hydroxymethylpyrimidine kinase/phosphomethylpyrimidine kinase [Candidatus Sumerlaeia bacterium]